MPAQIMEKAGCGCDIPHDEETYDCAGCHKTDVCVGCVWQCAACGQDFCESCIGADLAGKMTRSSVFICQKCLLS